MGQKGTVLVTLACLVLVGIVLECQGKIASKKHDETTIKDNEKAPLTQFKEQIESQLTEDYMHKDVYLIKWLRAKDLDVEEAMKMITEMLEWRKEYKMDTIFEEDFSDFIREFPFTIDAVDFDGRPVATADIADWDARKIILTGRRDRAIRFVFMMVELAMQQIMRANDEGFNIATGTILINLNGFNKVQHACSECLPIYRNMIKSLESYYPGLLHKLIGINASMNFYSVFLAFNSLLSKRTREAVKLYGPDKKKWQEAILSMISANELETQFGGLREKRTFDE